LFSQITEFKNNFLLIVVLGLIVNLKLVSGDATLELGKWKILILFL